MDHGAIINGYPTFTKPNFVYEFGVANVYKTILYDRYKDDCYTLKQMNIKPDEKITDFVVNKMFTKLLYNHTMLYNNLHSTFTFIRDEEGISKFKDTRYNIQVPKSFLGLSYKNITDHFIGINELMVTETFNRPLKKVFDMQVDLLNLCKDQYIDKYPRDTQTLDMSKNEYI